MFRERRERLMEAMGPDAVAVVPATPVFLRNNDVEHEYRADSDLYYLTGFTEPDAVLILRPGDPERAMTLLVRPRDPAREVWDGPRAGVDGATSQFGANVAFAIEELDKRLGEALTGRSRLYYQLGTHRRLDEHVLSALAAVRGRARKSGTWPTEIVEPGTLVHEMRWRKSEGELALMRRAAEITRDGFVRAMGEVVVPGRYEYEIEADLRATFRRNASPRPAYPPIVASGANACVLHYVSNDRRCEDGELLLIDAGSEFGGYASDVTRTFPVGATFSPAQRAIYDLVLQAQLASIDLVRAGGTVDAVHARSVQVITEGLVQLGILEGDPVQLIKDEVHKRYFMHGTSHWLGMDVHDVGRYAVAGAPRALVPGCVLTVEPGVYLPPGDERVPPVFRGIGVRIEDDVVCTDGDPWVLTADIPKEVSAIEALRARALAPVAVHGIVG